MKEEAGSIISWRMRKRKHNGTQNCMAVVAEYGMDFNWRYDELIFIGSMHIPLLRKESHIDIDFHDDIVTSVEQHMIVAFVRAYETNFHGQTKMRVVIKANIVKEVLLAPNLIGRDSDNRKEKLGTSYEEINSPDAFKAVKRQADHETSSDFAELQYTRHGKTLMSCLPCTCEKSAKKDCFLQLCNSVTGKELAVQGLRASRKLKSGDLSLYVGNGQREAIEAISVFHLSIPRDGIFEIDLSNSYANDSSMYAVSNKRAKLDLDTALLWHCRLGHISKKRIKKLQHDGLLNSPDLRVFEKCVSCMLD
ncbi:zinc finger, CCHC-type containing protein [Tanacetum coccineum]